MTEIISLKEAKKKGLKHYFTGKRCTRGHISLRHTSSRGCVQCTNIRSSEVYEKMPIEKRRARSAQQYKKLSTEEKLLRWAKSRTKPGEPFELTLEDVKIPEFCPVFGTKMKKPSIDRIDNTIRGYPKKNSKVICSRANQIKNDGTALEHLLIALYMLREEKSWKKSK